MSKRLAACLSILVVITVPAAASDWPHLRGPSYDGRAAAPGELGAGAPGLATDWRVPLGSGYSGIAAVADRVVTMFAAGDSDWVAAFDLKSGAELWRQPLGSVNRGRDGSADGPISSPVIADGSVYALGPKGRLLALDLDSGEVRWSRMMDSDLGSEEPLFGFGVTPILVDGKLLMLTGGESSAVTALDPEKGEILWAAGSGDYEYQVPVAISGGGRTQVVVGAGRRIAGLDPSDGEVIWQHELAEGEGVDGPATAVAADRFLVPIGGQTSLFQVVKTDAGFGVKELYRTRELGGTYALPVHHDGYLYGFRGQILTCVDAETGERRWRSRPPGGRGLILVGDKLAIFGAEGHVVLADASPEGYVERARIKALAASGYTYPSFAGGRVLVRNLEEMAAVRIGGAAEPVVQMGEAPGDGEFNAFVRRLEAADDKQPLIDAFLASHETLPVIEGQTAHFVFVGEAEDMAIAGTMTPTGGSVAMHRVAGTDFYHRSFEMADGGRWEYRFVRNFGERLTDPRNPRTAPPRWGENDMSVFSLSSYEPPAHLAERQDPLRGTIEEWSFESAILEMERQVKVYLPIGYHESENDYPLLVVHDGWDWFEKGLMANTLDNVIGRRARPVVVVFLKVRDEWWMEAGGTGTGEHVDMLVGELLPLLEERYRLESGPQARALMGNTGYALTSAYGALKHPEVFGKAALQSAQLGHGYEDALMELINSEPKADIDLYFEWNRYELRDLDSGVDLGVDSRRLAEALRSHGYEFDGGEMLDSSGWGGWRARTDRILESLFPLR